MTKYCSSLFHFISNILLYLQTYRLMTNIWPPIIINNILNTRNKRFSEIEFYVPCKCVCTTSILTLGRIQVVLNLDEGIPMLVVGEGVLAPPLHYPPDHVCPHSPADFQGGPQALTFRRSDVWEVNISSIHNQDDLEVGATPQQPADALVILHGFQLWCQCHTITTSGASWEWDSNTFNKMYRMF